MHPNRVIIQPPSQMLHQMLQDPKNSTMVADVRWTWPQLITLITGIALATAFTPSDFMHTNQPALDTKA